MSQSKKYGGLHTVFLGGADKDHRGLSALSDFCVQPGSPFSPMPDTDRNPVRTATAFTGNPTAYRVALGWGVEDYSDSAAGFF